jgi:sulfatase maturation enzyme AslB (radical SAM superfamily)
MQDLQIEPTNNTPLIDFYTSGKLILAGSAHAENAKEFFDPVIAWIEELAVPEVDFDLILEYINTSSAKKLLELLQKLERNKQIQTIRVKWFYQEWDEESLETGEILAESLTRLKFEFITYEKKK